jgi:hypothetical protein
VPKRHRSRSRIQDMLSIAKAGDEGNWSDARYDQEFQTWSDKNDDLVSKNAKSTAYSEFRLLTDGSLRGKLVKIEAQAKKIIDDAPVGTPLRFQHVLLDLCRKARGA